MDTQSKAPAHPTPEHTFGNQSPPNVEAHSPRPPYPCSPPLAIKAPQKRMPIYHFSPSSLSSEPTCGRATSSLRFESQNGMRSLHTGL
jgi:hypothetical protein